MQHSRKIAVVGLGYVGLPVAVAFARAGCATVGFDIDHSRIAEQQTGLDRTREVSAADLGAAPISFTHDPADLAVADSFIVTVPTPIELSAIFHKLGIDTAEVLKAAARSAEAEAEYGLALTAKEALRPAAAVILAVPHREFVDEDWPLVRRLLRDGEGAVLDVKSKLPPDARPEGVTLSRL